MFDSVFRSMRARCHVMRRPLISPALDSPTVSTFAMRTYGPDCFRIFLSSSETGRSVLAARSSLYVYGIRPDTRTGPLARRPEVRLGAGYRWVYTVRFPRTACSVRPYGLHRRPTMREHCCIPTTLQSLAIEPLELLLEAKLRSSRLLRA